MAKTPEGKVKDEITKLLDSKGIYWERRQAQGIGYKKGLPDIWCVVNGIHVEIEIKKEGGKPSSMQETWERYFKEKGIAYIRTDSAFLLNSYLFHLSEKELD